MTDAPMQPGAPVPEPFPPPPQAHTDSIRYVSRRSARPVAPAVWAAVIASLGATVAAVLVTLYSKTPLLERDSGGRYVFVTMALFAVAGLGWAVIQPAAQRAQRALAGAAAGAVAGCLGSLLLGAPKTHADAASDAVFSSGSLVRAMVWGVVTALAWAITIAPGSDRRRVVEATAGAALGGGAIGAAMGLLAGTAVFGTKIVATDVWMTLGYPDATGSLRNLPVQIVAPLVPLVLAATATRAARITPVLASGLAMCLLLPTVAGLAGYTTELDESRRNGGLVAQPDDDLSPPATHDVEGAPSTAPDADPAPDDTSPPVPEETSQRAPSDATTATDDSALPATAEPTSAPTTTKRRRATPPPPTQPTSLNVDYPVFVKAVVYAENTAKRNTFTEIVFGKAYRADKAPVQPGGAVVMCEFDADDAVIPFAVQTRGTSDGARYDLELRFSQSTSGKADHVTHPMSMEFNYQRDKVCADATDPNADTTRAVYEWNGLKGDSPGDGYGYIVIRDYWDARGKPVGRQSAVISVFPVINERYTTNTFKLYGGKYVWFRDEGSNDRYAAMRIII